MDIHDILNRLEGVKGSGGQYTARCPHHGDQHNSLSVSIGKDGRVLLNCHAGCSIEDVAGAMGLAVKDLFAENYTREALPAYSAPKSSGAPAQFEAEYIYPGGTLKKIKMREADGGKFCYWMHLEGSQWVKGRNGIEPGLYTSGPLGDGLVLVEGEKDVETLKELGMSAASLPDGAKSKWLPQYSEALRGKAVFIIQDNDRPGKEFAQMQAAALQGVASSVKVIDLTGAWPEMPEHGDITDLAQHMGLHSGWAAVKELIKLAPEWMPDEEGEANSAIFAIFEPFSPPDTTKLPTFPVEALPPVLRDMAAATAENLQVAVDMPALAELTVAALCLQGKFIINPKPGWLEPLNLYSVIVALPSDRKSPTMKVITRHVYEFVKEENARLRPLVDEYNMKRAILTKQIAGMVEKAAKPEGKTCKAVDPKDIVELQYQLADLENEEVRPLRLLADDVTPEALTSIMAENGGKMAVVSSEGGIFDIAAGRYSEKLNMDVFLKAYSGDYIQIDRKGRPSESIEHPALTMLMTVQPAVLEAIMGNTDFAGRGFLARFLYSLPVSTVGHRRYETPAIPFQTELAYEQLLDSLLSIKDMGQARIIKLSPEAHNEARRFSEELEPRLRDDLEEVEAWAGKYHGQVMRIAGIIHCCIHGKNAADEPVSLDTMLRAEKIGMYFLEHAQASFQVMGLSDDQGTKDAKYILKRLKACGQMEMSKRDLFQLCNGRFRRVEDLEVGMKVLVERGYMAVETIKTGKQGRPTENIKVNPELQKLQ